MLTWFIRWRLRAFERRYGYDFGYARDLLDADLRAFLTFAKIARAAQHRRGVPVDAWYAVKLVTATHEDCGPCAQLVVNLALEAGVAAPVLEAVVRRDHAAMTPAIVAAVRYAETTLARAPEAAEALAEATSRWGPRGVATLALAVTTARMFPTLKYALGRGTACARVHVASTPVVIAFGAP